MSIRAIIITVLISWILSGCKQDPPIFSNDRVFIRVQNEYGSAENVGLKLDYKIGDQMGEYECSCAAAQVFEISSSGDYLEVNFESKVECDIIIEIKDENQNVYIREQFHKKGRLITTVP